MLKMYTQMPFNLLIGFTVRSKHDSRFFITVILHVCRNFRDTGSEAYRVCCVSSMITATVSEIYVAKLQ